MTLTPQDPRSQNSAAEFKSELIGQSIKMDPSLAIMRDKKFLARRECRAILAEYLDTSIGQLGLPERVTNSLSSKGKNTIEDLLYSTDKDLLKLSGFGSVSLQDVYKGLRKFVEGKLEVSLEEYPR